VNHFLPTPDWQDTELHAGKLMENLILQKAMGKIKVKSFV
jgi:hypothetical protein